MSDNEDNLVETTGLICDVDNEIELVKAAKNGCDLISIIETFPSSQKKSGRGSTYVRILKEMKKHNKLPNDFKEKFSSLTKSEKDFFFEALKKVSDEKCDEDKEKDLQPFDIEAKYLKNFNQ